METIVVGIDQSANSRAALKWAIEHARPDDKITALHVWQLPPASGFETTYLDPAPFEEGANETAHLIVSEVLDELNIERDRVAVQTVPGHTSGALIDMGRSADLLVVGARGHGGFTGLILGSVTSSVVKHAPCPVVVVPDESAP